MKSDFYPRLYLWLVAHRRRVLLVIAEKRDKGSELRLREALTEAQFANVSIYSLDISTVIAALTDKGIPPRPPSIPPEATHLPGGYQATPTTVDQNYYVGNYIPVFVGCVFILVSVMPGPIMRGRSGVPHENQKLTRIVMAVLGLTILLAWYAQR